MLRTGEDWDSQQHGDARSVIEINNHEIFRSPAEFIGTIQSWRRTLYYPLCVVKYVYQTKCQGSAAQLLINSIIYSTLKVLQTQALNRWGISFYNSQFRFYYMSNSL